MGNFIAPVVVVGGVSALVLWFLFERVVPVGRLADTLAEANWILLPVVVALAALNFLAAVARWKLVLGAMGESVPFTTCFKVVLGVFPLAIVMPSRSNELLRGLALRERVPVAKGTGSVVVERLIDVLTLLVLVAAGSLVGGYWSVFVAAFTALSALWLFVFYVLPQISGTMGGTGGPIRTAFVRFTRALSPVLRNPQELGWSFAVSCLVWILACSMVFTLLGVYSSSLPWHVVLVSWPIAALAGALPITLAGMGARDGAFLLALVWLGVEPVDQAATLSATLTYGAIGIWTWAVIGVPFMIRLGVLEVRFRSLKSTRRNRCE